MLLANAVDGVRPFPFARRIAYRPNVIRDGTALTAMLLIRNDDTSIHSQRIRFPFVSMAKKYSPSVVELLLTTIREWKALILGLAS